MPRSKKPRYCRGINGYNLFKPAGIPLSHVELTELGLDELEAMRLCDLDGVQQEEAATEMRVSRATIQRLLETGRRKVTDALVHGKAVSLADAEHVLIRSIPPRGPGRHGRRFGEAGPHRGGPATAR